MMEKILVLCSRCGMEHTRHRRSLTAEVPFVCRICRCADCQIVFGYECDCGEMHGERDVDDPKICSVCAEIRVRVKDLDEDLHYQRDTEFRNEEPFWY